MRYGNKIKEICFKILESNNFFYFIFFIFYFVMKYDLTKVGKMTHLENFMVNIILSEIISKHFKCV